MSTIEVDKGYAWAVPVAGFIANFIVGGLAKSFGILIYAYIELFDCSASSLTVAGGLIYTFMYTFSIGSHYLCLRYGYRVIVAIGGIGASASLICASFAPNVWVFIVFIGGGLGISLSMIYSPIFVMVGRSFRRYAGIANGISVAGVSVGQILFPYIVTGFIELYTARGATMIGGAITLNFLVSAALLPRYVIEPESKLPPKVGSIIDVDKSEEEQQPLNGDSKKTKEVSKRADDEEAADHGAKNSNKDYPAWLSTRLLIVFICAKVFADIGDVGEAFVLPPFGKQLDFTPDEISVAISISGGVDLIARLFIGWFSDRPGVKRSLILFFAWFIEGFNSLFFAYLTSYGAYCAAYGVFGICSGTAMTLMVIVLTDFVGPPDLPKSFAVMMVVVGILMAAGQFFIGYIRDLTGGYEWSLIGIAIMMVYSSLVLLAEFPVRHYYSRHRPDKLKPRRHSIIDKVEYELTPTSQVAL